MPSCLKPPPPPLPGIPFPLRNEGHGAKTRGPTGFLVGFLYSSKNEWAACCQIAGSHARQCAHLLVSQYVPSCVSQCCQIAAHARQCAHLLVCAFQCSDGQVRCQVVIWSREEECISCHRWLKMHNYRRSYSCLRCSSHQSTGGVGAQHLIECLFAEGDRETVVFKQEVSGS